MIFTFSNLSMFPIHDVNASCQDNKVTYSDGEVFKGAKINTPAYYSAPLLLPGSELNISCPQLAWHGRNPANGQDRQISLGGPPPMDSSYANIPVSEAHIEMSAKFHYSFLWFISSEVKHCFSTQQTRTGELRWFEQPCTSTV
jgi:hypothetical protein